MWARLSPAVPRITPAAALRLNTRPHPWPATIPPASLVGRIAARWHNRQPWPLSWRWRPNIGQPWRVTCFPPWSECQPWPAFRPPAVGAQSPAARWRPLSRRGPCPAVAGLWAAYPAAVAAGGGVVGAPFPRGPCGPWCVAWPNIGQHTRPRCGGAFRRTCQRAAALAGLVASRGGIGPPARPKRPHPHQRGTWASLARLAGGVMRWRRLRCQPCQPCGRVRWS